MNIAPLRNAFLAHIRRSFRGIYAPYGLLALTVLLPMLRPGYILTLDMIFVPNLRMPDSLTASYPFHAMLHFLNFAIPNQILQKLMLLAILLLCGIGMHRLMLYVQGSKQTTHQYTTWGAYFAGVFYTVNPYTYSRFMAGQYAVLLGYACLPFFARALLRFLEKPEQRQSLVVAFWTVLIAMLSIHTLGLIAIVTVAALALNVWQHRNDPRHLHAVLRYGLASAGVTLLACSYWLIPFLRGTNHTAQAISNFGAGDQQAFATLGSNIFEKVSYITQLQGFWAEGQHLYVLPQNRVPAWGVVALAVWVLVIAGAVHLWRRHRDMFLVFGIGAVVAAWLATGAWGGWLSEHVPFFAGYREPQKFVGLVALTYSVFAGSGASAILHRYSKRSAIALNVAMFILLLTPLLFTRSMFVGFNGQLVPRQYPDDWFAVNQQLNADHDRFETLFLPWHLYTHFKFADRIIVSPAPAFFDKPTIINNDPEIGRAAPSTDSPTHQALHRILRIAPDGTRSGAQLAPLGIKYVMLAKEFDAKDYRYLDKQTDLQLVKETPTLKLYRNTAFGGQ